ncbi:RIP metalloprotease RseP [Litorivicinus lipolyticus]|uniref:Zinc metalloprotease n=1 Tax=Litorivicinus lipolyticus TaxID=418701 RepID=A0A5Q2QD92_9GAMM|nr:RIP metalloprotease RseP [Litorivicinus lipolyticus]QGG79967.1 RIP metalloprotease RseP [Litorivicinus lipolyticus]
MSLTMLFSTLTALGVLITVHEFGHFWVARRCGVRVLTFSIGFGPTVLRWHDARGTEYRIAALPLGGYVKMLDSREGTVEAAAYAESFDHKTLGQRAAIVAAGPGINFAFAVLMYFVLALAGREVVAPVLGDIEPGTAAERAGLVSGLEIVEVNGRAASSWQDVGLYILGDAGEAQGVELALKRPGEAVVLTRTLDVSGLSGELINPLQQLGITPWSPRIDPVVRETVDASPAAMAGLLPGDRIVRIDGRLIDGWDDLVDTVSAAPGRALLIELMRDGERLERSLIPAPSDQDPSVGRIGVYPQSPDIPDDYLRLERSGFIGAIGEGFVRTWEMSVFTVEAMFKMLTGVLSPANLSGPISIAKVATASAESGLLPYLGFLALLSVSLGVLNLMPIPVLDGGHLLWYAIEAITRRPVPEHIQALGMRVGMTLIMGLMMVAFYNDLT